MAFRRFFSRQSTGRRETMPAIVNEENKGETMDILNGWAEKMDGESIVGMMKCGVRSLSLLTKRSMEMVDNVKKVPSQLKHLREVESALQEASKKGKTAALNLKKAINPPLSEITSLKVLVNRINKKKKSSYMWWFSKAVHLKKALEQLESSVHSDRIHLEASELLKDFDNAIVAYEVVIKKCNKHGNQGSSMLQVACTAAMAILACVRTGVVALQVLSSFNPTSITIFNLVQAYVDITKEEQLDLALKKLIDTLDKKRENLISTIQANNILLKETQEQITNLQMDSKKKKLCLEALTLDLKFFPIFLNLAKSMRNFNILLDPECYNRLQNHHEDLCSLEQSCDELIQHTKEVYDFFQTRQSEILTNQSRN